MTSSPTHLTDSTFLTVFQRLLSRPSPSLSDALDAVTEELVAIFRAEKIDVFLHEEDKHLLVARSTSDTPMGRRQLELNLHRFPIAQGGRVVETWATGASYLTGHADRDPEIDRGTREALGVRSMMMVPLVHDGQRFGVLGVASRHEEYFTPPDLALLETVAQWVSLVAQRAGLADQLHAASVREARRAVAEEIIAVLAHDLQNYLLPLQARLYNLHRRALREQRPRDERDADEARLALTFLSALVKNLLDSARLTQGLFRPSPSVHNLNGVIRDLVVLLTSAHSPIEVEVVDPLVILADEEQMRQAITNLLINALEHSPSDTPVRVQTLCEPRGGQDWAIVSVSNKGEPIAPDLLPALFEPFTSGSSATGLGIGLYIAQQIAQQHGGTLTVSSDASGTTFTLALPFSGELNLLPRGRRGRTTAPRPSRNP